MNSQHDDWQTAQPRRPAISPLSQTPDTPTPPCGLHHGLGAAALLALQQLAGNAAVVGRLGRRTGPSQPAAATAPAGQAGAPTPVLQRWKQEQTGYSPGSTEGEDAFEARRSAHMEDAASVNFGVLYENGQKIGDRASQGNQLHSEPLLIGERILGLEPETKAEALTNPDTRLATFRKYSGLNRHSTAVLYTERAPCPDCRKVLDASLRANDVVRFTVPYADGVTMTKHLERLLSRARREKEERALEEEGDRRAAESRGRALFPWDNDASGMT